MSGPQHASGEKYAESMMNMMLLDPPRWGWTAMGGVADLLPPHERARRKETKKAYLKSKKRQRDKARLVPTAGGQSTAAAQTPATQLAPEKSVPDPASKENAAPDPATNSAKSANSEKEDQAPAASHVSNPQPPPTANGEIENSNSAAEVAPSDQQNNEPGNDAIQTDPNAKPTTEPGQEKEAQQSPTEAPAIEKPPVVEMKSASEGPTVPDVEMQEAEKSPEKPDVEMKEAPSEPKTDAVDKDPNVKMQQPTITDNATQKVEESQPTADQTTELASSKQPAATDEPGKAATSNETAEATVAQNESASQAAEGTDKPPAQVESEKPETAVTLEATAGKAAEGKEVSTAEPTAVDAEKPGGPPTTEPPAGKPTNEAGSVAPKADKNVETNGGPEKVSDAAIQESDEYEYVEGSDPNSKVIKIKTLREDGSLDLYTYHRGREGMEPRDATTGELLCDVPQTDSNHKFDEPRLTLQVNVSFPLIDDDELPGKNMADVPTFEETIPWDLSDPTTPTPMAFAARTAEEFGLSFGQTVDLAVGIQAQIYRHVREHCGYAVPVAMTDGAGSQRTNFPVSTISRMFGEVCVIEKAIPGAIIAEATIAGSKGKSKASKSSGGAHGSSSRRHTGAGSGSAASRPVSVPKPIYFNETVDEKFVEEVKKRMVQFSKQDIAKKAPHMTPPTGTLNMRVNYVCHICHKRHNLVGQFACGHKSHYYCVNHLEARLGLTAKHVTDKVVFDHCPICAATCLCSKCGRRRDALAIEMKRRSEAQGGADASDTVFDDMFTCYAKPKQQEKIYAATQPQRRDSIDSKASEESTTKPPSAPVVEKPKAKPKGKAKSSHKSNESSNRKGTIPAFCSRPTYKARPTDFPREMRFKQDVDPGTSIDYLTVFTAEGTYVKQPDLSKLVLPKKTDEPVEDGNVDYCYTCRKHGNLVCCDFCPRAFHQECLEGEGNEAGNKWECSVCRKEKGDLPEYILNGADSQPMISAEYGALKSETVTDNLTQIDVLCKTHEMLEKLMHADFGALFAVPVDSKQVPDYPAIIKKPMDLGTIAARIINGSYKKYFEANRSWDDIHLAILKDIELVWHNCFHYNVEGSSIYRMAEVLRRRMVAMRARNLDIHLSETVRKKVDEYVKSKATERGKISIPANLDWRPKSPYEIDVPAQKGGTSMKVAVLDPDTGMIVKIYTAGSAALKAAKWMYDHGLKCEVTVSTFTVKTQIKKSASEPSLTLFGYRWLYLDKLREGKVVFSEAEKRIFEMIDGESSSIFMSMDEALSDPRLPDDISRPELKKALLDLPKTGEVTFAGRTWRRLELSRKEVLLSSFWTENGPSQVIDSTRCLSPSATIAKEDVVLRRTLGGYESLDAAFEDWVVICKNSPSVPDDEISKANFCNYYLNGDRNVDGIIWKTLDRDDMHADDNMHTDETQAVATKPVEPETQDVDSVKHDGTVVSADPQSVATASSETQEAVVANIQVETARENIPAQPSLSSEETNGQLVVKLPEESMGKTPLGAPVLNANGKRERSEEEVLQPRKK
ncbi:Nucleosome-remodeling factor subunit NURF301 [Seminavis robusta]|uniref:Nucleosome-remodeling factor subunit NURF301 n=1 Tax=Seminavis robusta TaxID=568900 RepID=A0A9N8DAM5_9STRA|nr:Nucleosome-remodeling factor subunit NURF301 [Seminavis robusta]|eukprot:Sro59_g034250.1 Nucleosome-remodeling factor subunit NURF301 (1529) ;mRNA; r:80662-85450